MLKSPWNPEGAQCPSVDQVPCSAKSAVPYMFSAAARRIDRRGQSRDIFGQGAAGQQGRHALAALRAIRLEPRAPAWYRRPTSTGNAGFDEARFMGFA